MKNIALFFLIFLSTSSIAEQAKWLLIEFQIEGSQTIMKFPGVRADTIDECNAQAAYARKALSYSNPNPKYTSPMKCGLNCRFEASFGGPVCDKLIEVGGN